MTIQTALLLFGLLTVVMLFIEISFTYATKGFGYGFSSNRPPADSFSPLATRIKRAYQNQIESAAYGVPVLGAAAVMGAQTPGVELAALLFVLARALFAVLYYSGIPFIRVPAFATGTVSILYIALTLLFGATA